MLINAFPRAASLKDKKGWLPLHDAILRSQSLAIVRRLVEADPTAVMARNADGDICLDIFYRNWNLELRRQMMLMEDDDCERKRRYGSGDGDAATSLASSSLFDIKLNGYGFGARTIPYVQGEVRKIKWMYDAVTLLHKAVVNSKNKYVGSGKNDNSSTIVHKSLSSFFRSLHLGLLIHSCPWSIVRLLLKCHPHDVQKWDDNGNPFSPHRR